MEGLEISLSALELAILNDIAAGYQSKEIAARINRSKPPHVLDRLSPCFLKKRPIF